MQVATDWMHWIFQFGIHLGASVDILDWTVFRSVPQMSTPERYIPASALAARLDKIRLKMASLAEQIEDFRREEKLLSAILEEAVDDKSAGSTVGGEPKTRAKGVVEGIMEAIRTKPGLSKDELVEGLKYLNLNPFDQNAARRTILNNLGNQIRTGKVLEQSNGSLHLTIAELASGK